MNDILTVIPGYSVFQQGLIAIKEVVFFQLSPKSVRGCHQTLNETPQLTEGNSR